MNVEFTKKCPRWRSGDFFLGCRCLLLLLPTVQPFAYVVVQKICSYFCSNSGKKRYDEIEHLIHHLSAEAWGVGNMNIISHFKIFCQAR